MNMGGTPTYLILSVSRTSQGCPALGVVWSLQFSPFPRVSTGWLRAWSTAPSFKTGQIGEKVRLQGAKGVPARMYHPWQSSKDPTVAGSDLQHSPVLLKRVGR
jgi:hypothetical protein